MKKYLLLGLLFIGFNANGQELKDLIVTNNGDSIKCTITLINDQNIFYDHIVKKRVENAFISLSNVKDYKKNGVVSEIKEFQKIDDNDTSEYAKRQFSYCEIITTKIPFKNSVEIFIDSGNEGGKTYLRGKNGKVLSFPTTISALNYMGKRGWEVISTYTVKIDVIESIHYLLKKQL